MKTNQKAELGKLFFEEGIPGFTHLQFFQLMQEEEGPFFLLQSVEDENVGFWLVEPFTFFRDYQFTLQPAWKSALRIKDETPVAVFNIVTIRENNQVTVNLKAPIVANLANRMAKQVILNEENYQVRQPLFAMQSAAGE
jgi:flagellar assembly factor FliW